GHEGRGGFACPPHRGDDAKHNRDRQDDERRHAESAGGVPVPAWPGCRCSREQVPRHDPYAIQPPAKVTPPLTSTKRAGSFESSSQRGPRSPMIRAAVAAALASTHVAAATETMAHGVRAGRPVEGSMMWCSSTPPRRQRRAVVPDVARPPSKITMCCHWSGSPSAA